jgi:hypothetical protein
MMPIRKGDGTGISDVRLGDGTQIGEVRTGDGTVLWSAAADIPDSVLVQSGGEYIQDDAAEREASSLNNIERSDWGSTFTGVSVGPQGTTSETITWSLDTSDTPSGVDDAVKSSHDQLNNDNIYFVILVDFDSVNTVDFYFKSLDGAGYQPQMGYFPENDVSTSSYTQVFRKELANNTNWQEFSADFSGVSGTKYLGYGINHDSTTGSGLAGIQLIP